MRLALRTQKLTLSMASVGCLAAAGAVVAWGLQPPSSPSTDRETGDSRAKQTTTTTNESLLPEPTRESFAQLCRLPLRKPLYDPPPPAPVVRQLPPLGVELLGTVLEGENSMAMVRTQQGQVEYRRQGDSIGPIDSPAKIVEIQANAVLLERSEERITLQVQETGRR